MAFGQVRHAPDLSGIDGLRELLHIGISGMWPIIEATPDRQLLTYEITAQALRHRASGSERAGDIAGQQYRTMDEEAIEFLAECARIAGVGWGDPGRGDRASSGWPSSTGSCCGGWSIATARP